MRRCADLADCGNENRDSDLFCRVCALPLLSTALAGRYVVEALVSKGGYAAVFRGVDQNLSRRIAIKVLLPNKTTPTEQEHFLREARIAATLDHPNIAPILDYGKDGPSVFLVMPLYTAGSLRTRLAFVNGPLPAGETTHNFQQLVNALYYAHTRPRPVIHRDIKPENILIHQEDRRLVITDFGIARSLEPGARVGKRQGSGLRGPIQNPQSSVRTPPMMGQDTNLSSPAIQVRTKRGDSSISQQAVKMNTSGSLREKCQEGDQYLKQQHYSQALRAYEEALSIEPRNFYAWNGKGTALYNQGNYKKAYDAYQRAIEIEPENPVVWVSAGLALKRLQRYQQALVHFERALSIDPKYIAARIGKADTEMDMNLPEEAIASYEQALTYDQNSFQAWNGLGNARSYLRDYAGAVDAYSRALLINPRSAVAWCNKAEALVRSGHNRAALDALNEATELDRNYTPAWSLKADVYEALGNRQEAQKARKRAKPWGLMDQITRRMQAINRGNVDDFSAVACLNHLPGCSLGVEKDAFEVDSQHLIPQGFCRFQCR